MTKQITITVPEFEDCAYLVDVLEEHTPRRRGGVAIGELLPAILARLNIRTKGDKNRDRS